MPLSRRQLTLLFAAVVVMIFVGACAYFRFPFFPLYGDEIHFWKTSQLFSHRLLPSISQLRDYDDLNTPLPFVAFGAAAYLTHGGYAAGRVVNLIGSLVTVLCIGLASGRVTGRSLLSVVGLLLGCIYFLAVGTHLYTDPLAIMFGVLGVAFYCHQRLALSAVMFVLAVSCRQYSVAMPAAIAVEELVEALRARSWRGGRFLWPAAATASLFGWFVFFGGFAPATAMANQYISTAKASHVLIGNTLFFLTAIGVYYVIPELILFWRERRLDALRSKKVLPIAAVLGVLFLFFPPMRNVGADVVATMGFFDIAIGKVLPSDICRMCLYWVLATLAVARFARVGLPLLLLLANALIMAKAHQAWEKYTLPLLAALWYLRAIGWRETISVTPAPMTKDAAQLADTL